MVNSAGSEAGRADYYRRLGEAFFEGAVAGLREVPVPELGAAAEILERARRQRRRIFAFGNGGSASTASHLVCDLVKTAQRPGEQPLRAVALADNIAVLTAYANDVDYEHVFSLQLAASAEPGDIAIAISASGNSPNVLRALRTAGQMGIRTIGMLGCGGGAAVELVDVPLVIDSTDFGVIETAHLGIVHALAAALGAPAPQLALVGGNGSTGGR